MTRHAALLLAVLASCKTSEKKAGTPEGPPATARCSYVWETNNTCHEVYADGQVAALEAWCGKRDEPHGPSFTRGEGCPIDGRNGGCLYPNGSVKWRYKGDLSCIGGLEFKDAPKRKTSTPYRCTNDLRHQCRETQSVYDMSKTAEASTCETAGSTFGAGSCSTDNVIARCTVNSHTEDTVWLFYAPVPVENAWGMCKQIQGVFVEVASTGSAAGSENGSASTGSAAGSAAGSSSGSAVSGSAK